jgi:phosphatidylglycerol---prolipoprotein diacylglyceryl transferase
MLPYFQQPVFHVGRIPIHAFGIAVAIAVIVGIELAQRRSRLHGVDPKRYSSFVTWILVPGFIGAHLLDVIWYHPGEVLADPWRVLDFTAGLSSFGGFLGGLGGALGWRVRHGESLWPYADLTLSVFPVAWIFGRLGCTMAHDHPGIHTSANNPLAFAYPDGPRWDLGFLEMLFSIVLTIAIAPLWRRRRVEGTYVAIACLLYAPVRFGLDFLRADAQAGGDARYVGLTPAQWAAIALFAAGVVAARVAYRAAGMARRMPQPIRVAP